MPEVTGPSDVLSFWFEPANRKAWFRSTLVFDALIRERFESSWERAREGDFAAWESTPHGALALVLVLDQFPLNMFRGEAVSFSTEALAVEVAERALTRGFEQVLDEQQKAFLFLPFMHSESLTHQDRSVALFEAAGLSDNLRWARHHREIVHRFGRFPHRNAILDRHSTQEEEDWLASDQAFKG